MYDDVVFTCPTDHCELCPMQQLSSIGLVFQLSYSWRKAGQLQPCTDWHASHEVISLFKLPPWVTSSGQMVMQECGEEI